MYVPEAEWINKFESLLKRLCWEQAVLYNGFAEYKYVWEVDNEESHANFFSDPPKPPRNWSFSCYKCEYTEVSNRRLLMVISISKINSSEQINPADVKKTAPLI